MKVALYHPWIYLKGGIERTLLELVRHSRHDWSLFTGRYDPDGTFPEFRSMSVRTIGDISVKRDTISVARSCARMAVSGRDWSGYDALVVSCDGIGNLVTLRATGVPLVSLCHTPLKVAHDTRTRGRWLAEQKPSLATRAAVSLFTAADRPLWKRYRRIFCVSAEVERRLVSAGLGRRGQTEVAHPGVDSATLTPTGRREDFFLVPGRIMWTKNIELAIQAFLDLKQRAPSMAPFRLVIAGMVDEKSGPYLRKLRSLALGRDDIEFVVDPTDRELFDLYDRSFAVLFTPPNEDWGIVPLEAMAFGKPVISVASGGPLESIVDGKTGFLLAPEAYRFVDAMERLVRDPSLYHQMSAAARERATLFSWQRFAGQIDDYLDTLAASPGRAVAGATSG